MYCSVFLFLLGYPAPSLIDAKRHLKKTALNFANKLSSSALTRYESWLAYLRCGIPALSYCLLLTHFKEEELRPIQALANRAFLAKTGFKRTTPRSVIHGPAYHGGKGVPKLYNSQSISKIILLIRHIRANNEHSDLMKIGILWWQLFSGMPKYLLEYPEQRCEHVKMDFFPCITRFLKENQGQIIIQDLPPLDEPYREEDIALMEAANRLFSPQVSKRELESFNHTRLFL